MKQKAEKAWKDFDEFSGMFHVKQADLDNAKAEVEGLESAIQAREGLDGLAQEAERKRTALNEFRDGDLTQMQQAVVQAEAAMEGKAEGTEEYKEANKALEEARKKANRAESQAA